MLVNIPLASQASRAPYSRNIYIFNLYRPKICSMSNIDVSTEECSDANASLCTKILNWCRQIFNNLNDNRPSVTEENDEAKFWNKRAQCGRLQLLSPLFTAFLFVADVGMDCEIAATHFQQGDYRWSAYTLGVVVFSLIIIDVLSASFYFSDQRNPGKTEWLTMNGLQVRPWFYGFHFIFCGRLVR